MKCSGSSCSVFKSNETKSLYQLGRVEVYNLIHNYYANTNGQVTLKKVPSNNPDFAMYGGKIPCMCNEKRYIFAICPQTPYSQMQQNGFPVDLRNLQWASFQTRTTKTDFDVPILPEIRTTNQLVAKKIFLEKQTEKTMIYEVEDVALRVELLDIRYAPHGDLKSALETYNTVITWRD